MTRTYATWVEPIATVLADDHAELMAFVRAQPPSFWEEASVVEGWRNREILAHLAGGNDQLVQELLRATVNRAAPDPSIFAMDTDEENARRVAERASWSIAQMIEEMERDTDEVDSLLTRLTVEDRGRRFDGFEITLGQFLRIVQKERHDILHLEQLRAGSSPGD